MNNNGETSHPCIYFAIGILSRSLLEGLDIVYCTFQKKHLTPTKWDHALIRGKTVPYPSELLEKIKTATSLTVIQFYKLDRELGIWIGQQTKLFIQEQDIGRIDIVGAHGHTVLHDPSQGISVQIGHPACIAAIIQKSVVGDFRSIDIALGGQGAPLIAIGDRLLYEKYSFCLDLADSASITYLNPNDQINLIAYDVCICNQLLDYITSQINLRDIDKIKLKSDDNSGIKEQKGLVNPQLLEIMNDQKYYSQVGPKLLKSGDLSENIIPIFDKTSFKEVSLEDKFATSISMIVDQVSRIVQETQQTLIKNNEDISKSIFMPKYEILEIDISDDEQQGLQGQKDQQNKEIQHIKNEVRNRTQMRVLASGKGVSNIYLMDSLQTKLQELGVLLEQQPQDTKFKEAMNFGFLAVLRIRKEINIMKCVTGAQQNSVGGCIYYHDNF